ncbi:hypothetical protein SESBI_07618 [Sesbania bispinosa]|nr:hypothetical protein SESBI_07618 [Sesbania bispinosa]
MAAVSVSSPCAISPPLQIRVAVCSIVPLLSCGFAAVAFSLLATTSPSSGCCRSGRRHTAPLLRPARAS